MFYGNFEERYNRDRDRYNNQNNYQQNTYNSRQHEPGEQYRMQQHDPYSSRNDNYGTREDYYNEMYDIANYSGVPREDDYGLPHGPENDLMSIKPMPLQEGPYFQHRRYNYSSGYNPNYDNPEEGDMYRNFDSRGNHGYRHDASYGNEDEFRDFGNDHYGSQDHTNRTSGDRYRGYDRY
ncbi:hypothetical protein GWO68_06085 [Pontibacter sp. BT213]|uniref:Uncharacterized protein n=2 Tax=Pontibacter fetidus TaxID=2700082 RepID=A0A6B2GX18_9BACT|nr:hypothetical protein [Pontibacter fetidus]